MSDTAARPAAPDWLFAATVFVSAALVFMVEPMIARLVLPILGGSSAVWNTSLAFFQVALLAGYVYAHALQRLPSLRGQIVIHGLVLLAAAMALPLAVSRALGDPFPDAPALWLVATLTLSIGAPFAALSATAPLLQAWHARVFDDEAAAGPWGLYAASNLGSLLSLLAYPVLIEPNLTLDGQRLGWSLGYAGFVLLLLALGADLWRGAAGRPQPSRSDSAAVTWTDRARWIALAAIPSSLLLGVTSFVTTDVGSAPFLWIAPMALYLLTFVIAFQARPMIPPRVALVVQAAALVVACVQATPMNRPFLQGLSVHLLAFFFSALVCHQALVARRPAKGSLTDFYICVSLGGVVGGAFNAFLAPVLFDWVVEYPAALVLSALARPWGRPRWTDWCVVAACVALAGVAVALGHVPSLARGLYALNPYALALAPTGLIAVAAMAAFLTRRAAWPFAAAALVLVVGGDRSTDRADVARYWRGFFGVMRETRREVPGLGGEVRALSHGTTVHGAQARAARFRCRPLMYYSPQTPIGQVFEAEERIKPRLNVAVIGLGTGATSAYDRVGDAFRYFEIDPLVVKVATDPAYFSYLSECARGSLAYTLGDARLTMSRKRPDLYDVLLVDAFSSDSVPAHMLTVEAARLYLAKIRPDGVVILHVTNRNLDLAGPAQAVALAAGGVALFQDHPKDPASPELSDTHEAAVLIARNAAALAPFAADGRWESADPHGVRPWTDNYTDLFGALTRKMAR